VPIHSAPPIPLRARLVLLEYFVLYHLFFLLSGSVRPCQRERVGCGLLRSRCSNRGIDGTDSRCDAATCCGAVVLHDGPWTVDRRDGNSDGQGARRV
jgi:hypothetical protein